MTAAGAGLRGPEGHAAPWGFHWGEGAKAAAARPVLSFPGHVPLVVPDPRVPGVPGERGGGNPRASRRSRRCAEVPDQWLWASRGSCLGQHGGQPALALAARPSPRERARNVSGTFCPQLLGKPRGQPLCPRRQPSRAAFRPGAGVAAGGSAPGRLGSAGRRGTGGREPSASTERSILSGE